jgi:hypothetical protein
MFNVMVTAGQAGDEALTLHLGTGGSDDGSIPVIVRSLVPLSPSGGSFSGSLTGGGANGNAGQSFTYQFNVMGNKPSLNVGLQLAHNNYNLNGFLIDPNGQPVDAQSTAAFDANDHFLGFGPTMQFFRRTPAPGLWTLVLNVAGPGDGAHLSEPFTGSISFAAPSVSSSGIPNSPSTVLPAGQPVTATITITNTGNSRKDFFADARLNGQVPQELLGSDVNNVPLPLSVFAQPNCWSLRRARCRSRWTRPGPSAILMCSACRSATIRSLPWRHQKSPQGSSSASPMRPGRSPPPPTGR